MNHIDLLVNPKKIHIPKHNNNNISLDTYKTNISNHIKNYNFNFNKKLDINDTIDLLMFIQHHETIRKNVCNDCKKKINECLK